MELTPSVAGQTIVDKTDLRMDGVIDDTRSEGI